MRTRIIILLLITGNFSSLFANVILPVDEAEVHLAMKIIGTEGISATTFSYDIVGLEADATATYLTSGVTLDLNTLVTDIKISKRFVELGIKLNWDNKAKYFLFDRTELTYGFIDLSKGKD
jgi:hypothetical protein